MKRGVPAAVALLFLAAQGCNRGAVALRYLYPQGRVSSYRWTIDGATTAWAPSHSLHLVVGVQEEVAAALPGRGARLRLTLTPTQATQDGAAIDTGPPLALELEVGAEGSISKVVGASNLPAGALTSLELDRLLSESRPPLASRPVALHGRWKADLSSKGPSTTIVLGGSGTLDGFALRNGRRLAELSTNRQGTVRTQQSTPAGTVTLAGRASDRSSARLDLDRGVLVDATSRATSTFELSGTPPGGELRVDLTTHVVLTGVAKARSG